MTPAALQQREVPLEALLRRPLLGCRSKMPFARHIGVVARVAHHARHANYAVVEMPFVARLALLLRSEELGHVAETCDVVVRPREQH